MASWLAYLKSRLLLPRNEKTRTDDPPAEQMAAALAFRLRKLEAMRLAATALLERPQLSRDVFVRGDPQATVIVHSDRIEASLYDLMSAYVTQRRREQSRNYNPGQRVEAFALEAARDWLRDYLPQLEQWTPLNDVAPGPLFGTEGPSKASYLASTLSAGLELVKEGALDLKQVRAFEDIYLKRRDDIGSSAPERAL
jgi:segregation and condensation protein A